MIYAARGAEEFSVCMIDNPTQFKLVANSWSISRAGGRGQRRCGRVVAHR